MKIGIVNQPWNHAPPHNGGSIAIWTFEVARRLATEHEVTVYARRARGQPAEETHDGVRCVRFPIERDLRWISYTERIKRHTGISLGGFDSKWFYAEYARQVARDAERRAFDVVHAHNFSRHAELFSRRLGRTAIVLHMHCEWLTQLDRGAIARRLRRVAAVTGCSDYIADKVRSRFPELSTRCHTLYNGVDVEMFHPKRRDAPAGGGTGSRVLFVGRITPEKGLHVLMAAMGAVAEAVPDVTLDVVGPDAETPRSYIVDRSDQPLVRALASQYDGRYLDRLRRSATEVLDKKVTFPGLVHQSRLGKYYHAADLLVNPSLSESFGMSLIEAMAAGTPVVAARTGGMPEIVSDGKNGWLVDAVDSEALARAVAGALRDREALDRAGAAARQTAVERFSWDRIADQTARTYREAID